MSVSHSRAGSGIRPPAGDLTAKRVNPTLDGSILGAIQRANDCRLTQVKWTQGIETEAMIRVMQQRREDHTFISKADEDFSQRVLIEGILVIAERTGCSVALNDSAIDLSYENPKVAVEEEVAQDRKKRIRRPIPTRVVATEVKPMEALAMFLNYQKEKGHLEGINAYDVFKEMDVDTMRIEFPAELRYLFQQAAQASTERTANACVTRF